MPAEARSKSNSGRHEGRLEMLPEPLVRASLLAIELTRQASRISYSHFAVDFSDPINAKLPHLPMLRKLSLVLRDQAIYEARHGDTQAAVADSLALFRIAQHADNEPIMITYLISLAIDRFGYEALSETLRSGELDPAQLQQIAEALPRTEPREHLANLLRTERSFGLWCFENVPQDPFLWVAQMEGGGRPPRRSVWSYPVRLAWTPFARMDEAYYLGVLDHAVSVAQQPLFSSALDTAEGSLSSAPNYAIGTRILAPSLSGFVRRMRDSEVRRREALVAVALAAYRFEHHAYPNTLDVVKGIDGPLPQDPFTEAPFRYRRSDTGCELYSPGPNHHDDGGKDTGGADDVAWL